MAEGLNRVMLLGNLGADPELRFTQGGQGILSLRLATTRSYLDKNKVRQEQTDWHTVVVWGKRGEGLHKVLTKGSSIFVEGRLQTSSYDDREGVKRYKTEVIAENVILAGGRGGRGAPVHEEGGPPEGDFSSEASAPRSAGPSGSGYARGGAGYGSGRTSGGAAPARPRPAPPAEEPPAANEFSGDFGGGGGEDDIPF